MQDDRSPDALIDDAIAREIETALAVKPSPEFVASVRARIAAEPAAPAWHFDWHWAAVAAIVVIAASVAVGRLALEPPVIVQLREVLPHHVPHSAEVPHAPAIAARGPNTATSSQDHTGGRPVRRAAAPIGHPEVLIPATERAALRRLLQAGIRGEQIEPTPAVIAEAADTSVTLDEINISPIAIEPLAPIVPPQGEHQ